MPPRDPDDSKPDPSSPYDFIQQMPYDPGPKSHKKRWLIIAAVVTSLLLLIGVVAAIASQTGSNQTNGTASSNETPPVQDPTKLEAYTESEAFTISYPGDFGVVPPDDEDLTEATLARVAFYKDANDEELNGFGVEIIDTELDIASPTVDDDYAEVLQIYTAGQAVTNLQRNKIKTSGQDAVKVTADFMRDDTPAKIVLIRASVDNRAVLLWFTATASNQTYLNQIDPILASFQLY